MGLYSISRIALVTNDLRRLPVLLRLSRQTRAVINQNSLLGLAFVVGGMVLGAFRFITPVIAAIFHVTGSLLVVFNSFRLVRHGEELEPHLPETAPHSAGASTPSHEPCREPSLQRLSPVAP